MRKHPEMFRVPCGNDWKTVVSLFEFVCVNRKRSVPSVTINYFDATAADEMSQLYPGEKWVGRLKGWGVLYMWV